MNSLYDIRLIAFIFGPLTATVISLALLLWIRTRSQPGSDASSRFLRLALSAMPASRREWRDAMLAELAQCEGTLARLRFAIGCAIVAMFPPRYESLGDETITAPDEIRPVCGVLAVSLPSLGLPFVYLVAIAMEGMLGRPGVSTSELFPPALLVAVRLIALGSMLSGVPLALAGVVRGERARTLLIAGPVLSIATFAYFFILMTLMSGPPGAD